MDYEKLFEILPKHPKKWNVTDVSKWLHFINLQSLVEKFSKFYLIQKTSQLMVPILRSLKKKIWRKILQLILGWLEKSLFNGLK